MDALLFTLGMIGLIVVAVWLLARSWPRTSGLGGYRAGRGAGRDQGDPGEAAGGGAPGDQEDDDAHWDWHDRPGGEPPGS